MAVRKGSGRLSRVTRMTPPLGTLSATLRERPSSELVKRASVPPPPSAARSSNTPSVIPSSMGPSSMGPSSMGPSSAGSHGGFAQSTAKVDFGLMTPAARVVEELLCIEPDEHVVIVHDEANAEMAVAFEHASTGRGAHVTRVAWGSLFERPLAACPPDVLTAVRTGTATVLAVSWERGEYDARFGLVNAVTAAKTRHVHMVGVGRRAFLASMMASTSRVFDLLQTLRAIMRPTSRLSVRSAAGTAIEIEMAPHLRWFANGNVVRPGQFVNVPFGALISSPASVSGTYVADASIGGGYGARVGLLESRPVRLVIEAGRVRRIECRDIAVKRYVESFLSDAQGHDRVGLVSLGANLGILSPLGELLHDENMPGLHLSLGETYPTRTGATWTSHGQLAFAGSGADVDLDGEPLVRRGRYVRFV